MAEKKITAEELEEKNKQEEKEREIRTKNITQISKIIAAINPDRYSDNPGKIKALLKQNKFWAAVDIAKPSPPKGTSIKLWPNSSKGYQYKLIYNSPYETLEPMYFWILDYLDPSKTEKLVDNFQSSPGSGHFSELMGKATRMQEEGMKVMQTIGVLIKSIINIIYDLRQFEIRLEDYAAAKSKDKARAEAGNLALKQTWLDNVDIKRGNTSVKAMAFSQASFATLIDAFMVAQSLEQITKKPEEGGLDLNERVKNILKQRYLEFSKWKELSEQELRKRYNIERSYLKSQVDSLKLYSRWAKPYLKSAEELKMITSPSAALVKAFNTIILELTLLRKTSFDVAGAIVDKRLPRDFEKWLSRGKIREYFVCTFVDLTFRGIPQRAEQHYTFGGRADVVFKAYALNKEEIDLLKSKLEESDLKESMKLVEGATDEALGEIQEDIDYYLKGVKRKDESQEEESEKEEDVNPFSALLGFGKSSKKSKSKADKDSKDEKIPILKPDNYAEEFVRALAEKDASEFTYKVYDIYKKSHGMPSPKEQV